MEREFIYLFVILFILFLFYFFFFGVLFCFVVVLGEDCKTSNRKVGSLTELFFKIFFLFFQISSMIWTFFLCDVLGRATFG